MEVRDVTPDKLQQGHIVVTKEQAILDTCSTAVSTVTLLPSILPAML